MILDDQVSPNVITRVLGGGRQEGQGWRGVTMGAEVGGMLSEDGGRGHKSRNHRHTQRF